jgi:PAS domain S-box-containing protein
VRGHPVRDIDGSISRWHVLLTDVDDRKRGEETARAREEQLRRSEALLLEAQRLTRTGSWSHDPVTGRIASSPEMRRAFGVRPDEDSTTREFWLNKVHPDDRQRVHELFSKSELEKTDYETDYRVVRPDGTIRHKHAVGHPIVSESGDLVEFIVTTMDVTEQWQARTELEKANLALRASERELSLIIETIPGLVWCASPDGEFTYMNQRILNYIGTSESDLTRGGWANFLHPDDRESAVAAWSHAVATGQPFELEIRLRRYDGVYRWMHTLSQLDRDSEGHSRRWYGLLIDIDDRKHAENALRSTQTRLTRATQIATVGELSASIAHEINQPLAAVVANGHACLRWLAAQPPNLAKAREAVERVVRDGKEAGEVVARIRALFKRATLQEVALDLNEVIGEVLRLLRGETAKRHVTVETDLAHDLPSVMGDRVQLQQLVLNLLLNGVEAMDPVVDRPRTLLVRTRRDGSERILVEMRDSGLGLKDPEKVFEAFFTTKENGMGMGLTICRSIVEAHHGRVWAASGEGPGATFCFTLPLTPGAAP